MNLSYRVFYSFIGGLLGAGAPLGWLAWRTLFTQGDWLLPHLQREWSQHGEIYVYMSVGTILMFSLFGYVLGQRGDRLKNETMRVKKTFESLNQMATTDGLTGLYNARYLHDRLTVEVEEAGRYQFPLTCLLFDIDNFKTINDTYGHPYGDGVLVTVARILRESVRRVDIPGRFGGEEFLVLMPHTPPGVAFQIAERIRQAVQNWPFVFEEIRVPVTISLGVTSYPSPHIPHKAGLLKAIDEALYQAKRTGKNCTIVWKRSLSDLLKAN